MRVTKFMRSQSLRTDGYNADLSEPFATKLLPNGKFSTPSFDTKSIPPTHIEHYLDVSESNSSSGKAGDFILIQVGNDRGPRTEARSHAMRGFWREKKLQMTKKARVS
ncbi:hypothetical protein BHYA_0021g00190 [Botrytis hyacinthi]|uniref:Uncharacterized protein n=1 Tax=Botrytis hyacinthi TaxID=278943 RepID=A0A4Z1H2S3_9HELO|nr:hypothetical protein BHYA_0021g00190 [Botrytis hyacinthi]